MGSKKEAMDVAGAFGAGKRSEIEAFKTEIEEYDIVDDDFLDGVKEMFGHWTANDFKEAGFPAFVDFRHFVQNHGVYVKNHRVPGGNQYQAMVDTVAADNRLEWPPVAAIAAATSKAMQTHDPVLQRILGRGLIEPRFILIYSRKHDGDDGALPQQHQQVTTEEAEEIQQLVALESQQPRQIVQAPYGNQDARFDSRLEAESGQQQPLQREVPIRTTPLADASSASVPELLYAKLAAEDEEEANGTAAVDFVETTSCDEDNGDLCTLTASIEDGSHGGGRSTAVRIHRIDKADARIPAITGAAVRCGYDRPARAAGKLFAIAKEDEPPDRLGDDRLRILLRKLAAARLISLPQESQVVTFSPVSSSHHVGKGTRGGVSEHLAIKRQYIAQSTRGAYYVMSLCHSEAAFYLLATAKRMVHAAHMWFLSAGRGLPLTCKQPHRTLR